MNRTEYIQHLIDQGLEPEEAHKVALRITK